MRSCLATLATLAAIFPAAGHAGGDPAPRVIAAIEAVTGTPVTEPQRAAIAADVARAWAEKPEDAAFFLPLLDSTAVLAASAESRVTRIFTDDLNRQVMENLVVDAEASPAVAALDAANEMVAEIRMGLGLTARDLISAGMLEAMGAQMPQNPEETEFAPEAMLASANALVETFNAANEGDRHFLARIDAWTAGVVEAWPELSPEERAMVTGVTRKDDLLPEAVIAKVTGTSGDLILWLAAMDLDLTEAEREAHPELIDYMAAAQMAGGVDGLIEERAQALAAAGGMGAVMAQFNSVQMMQNLNYFNFNHGIFSGMDATGAMMGMDW